MVRNFDFVIVGAGIVGLSVATKLLECHPDARVIVLEKESGLGAHASGRNSGVMHSGIYYGSDTLKAKVCADGCRRMVEFAETEGISVNRCGKIILQTSEAQAPVVERLIQNAADNGIPAEFIDEQSVREIEPYAAPGCPAIYCPTTAVVDPRAVLSRLKERLSEKGVAIEFCCEVSAKRRTDELSTTTGKIGYGYLFNCAGAYADVIAKQFGLAHEYTILPFKGIYWKLSESASSKVRANIYPVPDISVPFLGVHFTRMISGEVYIGPTAIPAFGRENYGIISGMRASEFIDIARHVIGMYVSDAGGFRKLAHDEIQKYRKRRFLEAARNLVPSLNVSDLVPSRKVGIRPQLVNINKKELEMDYILLRTVNTMHVLNAISPAFTSAFSFADLIVEEAFSN